VGELSVTAMRSVVRRYSDAFFETAKRRRAGERARYPRRKRALFPLRWYQGTFAVDGRRVRLSTARGSAPLWVRLSRECPYPAEQLRSVTLVADGGRLWLDVTAAVAVETHDVDQDRVAGIDLGIIHPYAVASSHAALLVSGRQIRAEERLHLADTKARAKRMSPKAPRRGQRGSRRWRQLRAAQRRAETRHRTRVHLAHHQGAKAVITWAIGQRVGTLVVGDPIGITRRDVGKRQNLRLRQWRRTHLMRCLIDKAEVAGIRVVRVDERGTSSTCPECRTRVPKPQGRKFSCPQCGHRGHRDLIAARNIAGRTGGSTSSPLLVLHRRAGTPPARRDRRRHLMDAHRSCPAPGRLPTRRSRSPENPTRATARRSVHVDPIDNRRGSNNQPNQANVA
jgi:IS605 OrfB family transposase